MPIAGLGPSTKDERGLTSVGFIESLPPTSVMAKPYAASHVGAVAAAFTEMRLSGAVKESLVGLLLEELDGLVPRLEAATLDQDPERKTLGDPDRVHLNYNRTRELMIERIQSIESVGSAAVQRAIEDLEMTLSKVIRRAADNAESDRVSTIKPRHLAAAIGPKTNSGPEQDEDGPDDRAGQSEDEADLDQAIGQAQVLTPQTLRRMARSFATMPVTDEALEELLLLYYDVVEETEHSLRNSFTSDNPQPFIDRIAEMQDLMRLGWMRRMLKRSGELANERGYKRVDIEQVVNLDPFE